MRWPVILVIAGCGRIGFDGEARPTDVATDMFVDERTLEMPGQWRPTEALPGPREFGCALGFEDRIYAIGGTSGPGGSVVDVLSARVDGTGLVAGWESFTPMPTTAWWHACALDEAHRMIYVTGGFLGPMGARDTVLRASIASDGSVGEWTSDRLMPGGRRGHGAFVSDGQLCIVGGETSEGFAVQDDVYCAVIEASGALSPWTSMPSLPVADYMFGTTVVGDHVFVTGGYVQTTEVRVATVGGAFASTTPLPASRQRHAAVATGGYLHVIGGEATFDTPDLTTAARARIDGATLGAWEPLADLPTGIAYASAAVVQGRIYVIGGSHDDAAVATVYVMTP